MSTSIFDPSSILDANTTEAATKRPPIPAGTILKGIISDITVRQSQGKKDPSKTYTFMDIKIVCPLEVEGYPPEVTLTHGISLDLGLTGNLDWSAGKNGQLKKYRDALDMNTPGVNFAPRQLIGRQIGVKVKHETYEGEIYDRVDSVVRAF